MDGRKHQRGLGEESRIYVISCCEKAFSMLQRCAAHAAGLFSAFVAETGVKWRHAYVLLHRIKCGSNISPMRKLRRSEYLFARPEHREVFPQQRASSIKQDMCNLTISYFWPCPGLSETIPLTAMADPVHNFCTSAKEAISALATTCVEDAIELAV